MKTKLALSYIVVFVAGLALGVFSIFLVYDNQKNDVLIVSWPERPMEYVSPPSLPPLDVDISKWHTEVIAIEDYKDNK